MSRTTSARRITMSDRIAVMNDGRIEQLDAPETLYAQSAHPLRRRVHRRIQFHSGRMPRWRGLVRRPAAPHGRRGAKSRARTCWWCGRNGCASPLTAPRSTAPTSCRPGAGHHLPGRQFHLLRGARRRPADRAARLLPQRRARADCRPRAKPVRLQHRRQGRDPCGGRADERCRRTLDRPANRR